MKGTLLQVANLQEEIEILGSQMANLGLLSWGGSTATDNQYTSNTGSHFLQSDSMNLQLYQDQHDPMFPCPSNAPDTQDVGDLVLNDVSNNGYHLPPLYGGEGQDLFCDDTETDPSILERLFDGVDHEILALYPWLNNATAAGK